MGRIGEVGEEAGWGEGGAVVVEKAEAEADEVFNESMAEEKH